MKRIFRMVIFSAAALFFTALWNRGFILPSNIGMFVTSVLALAFIIYIIIPISKVILLPFNIITLGLLSFIVFLLIFHFSTYHFHFFVVSAWDFPGFRFLFITLPPAHIPYWGNLVLSSVSISGIINILEQLL